MFQVGKLPLVATTLEPAAPQGSIFTEGHHGSNLDDLVGSKPTVQLLQHVSKHGTTRDDLVGIKPSVQLLQHVLNHGSNRDDLVGRKPSVQLLQHVSKHGTTRDDLVGIKPSVQLLQHVSNHGSNRDDLVGSKPTVQLLPHVSKHGNNNSSYVGETENQIGSIISGRGSNGLSHPNSNQCIRIRNSVTRDNNSYTSDQSMMPQSYYGVNSADSYVRNDDTEPTSVQDALISLAQNAGSSLFRILGELRNR